MTLSTLLRVPDSGLGALAGTSAQSVAIERVVSPGGVEAWLVQDHQIPVVAVEFAFDGGAEQDPDGKDGLSAFVADLLDEGAGAYDSTEFQRRLADHAINLGFLAQTDTFSGGFKTLVETEDEAFELLRLALTAPRFDDEAVQRIRQGVVSSLRREQADPHWLARRVFFREAFADHPYGRSIRGSIGSVAHLNDGDCRDLVARQFTRDRLRVAVTGAITPTRLAVALDRMFGGLPATSAMTPVAEVTSVAGGQTVQVSRTGAQTVLVLGQQGIKRSDPDWFAATIMNYVLGGGSLGSRLMTEVREKRGLSYGVHSYLQPFDHGALIVAGGATANDKAGETLAVMRAEWARMAEGGISAEELADAKTYLTGSFPLQFSSTDAIARLVLQIRRDNLGIDYLRRRDALIEAVSLADVARVARRLLDPRTLITVIVGQPKDITPTRIVEAEE
ncbi:MAG: pitrilysin family protein [Azospirillaceae bacterium]|nr:pitrilysin family protein [Azospirillaceae bacterium]